MAQNIDDIIIAGLELAQIGFYRYLFDGTVLSMDQVSFNFFELDGFFENPQSVIGQNIESLLIYTGPRRKLREIIRKSGKTRGLEYNFKTLKGTEKWGVHNSYLLVDEETGKEAVQVCFYDITKPKQIELSLREINERYQSLVSTIPHGIVETDASGKVLFVNEAFTAMTGFREKDLIGTTLIDLFVRDYLYDIFYSKFAHIMNKERKNISTELKLKNSADEIVHVDVNWSKKILDKEEDEGYVVVLTDVSERSELEALLQDRQKMDSIGVLLSGISHDFNNVLASIISLTETICFKSDNLTSMQKDAVSKIFQTIKRATDLIGNIHSATGRKKGEMAHFDLFKVASELFQVLERTTDKEIEKIIDFKPDKYIVYGDESDIYQVLVNLSTNAIRAVRMAGRESKGVIRLSVVDTAQTITDSFRDQPKYHHIIFEDNGCGMDRRTREKAFIPFYSTKSKDRRKGQGLGLASVYYVVTKKHGGFIEIESQLGKGTRFHLYLPRKEAEIARDDEEEMLNTLQNPNKKVKGRILVMEDEAVILRFLELSLQSLGYDVLVASNGAKGLEIYEKNQETIEIVIVDMSMPILGGEEVIQRISRNTPHIKIIAMSGHLREELGHITEICSFLKKPFTLDNLNQVLENCRQTE